MKVLVKEKLSPHKSKTPEGYLICRDAILARTGEQEYYASELYPDWHEEDKKIKVLRKPEEVFSEQTLASFENKPITCEHPDEDVTSENNRDYAVGFIRDIRRGQSNGEDVMLGNLIITDSEIVKDIEDGIRTELSCGYNCDITEGDHPEQVNIRGNHVALCERGRAGCAKIIDSVDQDIVDVKPRKGEKEDEFISRFMSETKEEYPDQKQRYAIAKSYWQKRDSIRDHTNETVKSKIMISFGLSKEKIKKMMIEQYNQGNLEDQDLDDIEEAYFEKTGEKLFNTSDENYVENFKRKLKENKFESSEDALKVLERFLKHEMVDEDEYEILKKMCKNKFGIKDSSKLPQKVRKDISAALSRMSGFTHKDLYVTDLTKKIYNVLWLHDLEDHEIIRDKIEGWYQVDGGINRKDYFFHIDGFDDQFMISIYADNDEFRTTEVNAGFTDSVEDDFRGEIVDKKKPTEYRGYEISLNEDGSAEVELERGIMRGKTLDEAKQYVDEFIEKSRNMLRDRKIERKVTHTTHDAEYSPHFKKQLRKEIIRTKNDLLEEEDIDDEETRMEFRKLKQKTLSDLRKNLRNAQKH